MIGFATRLLLVLTLTSTFVTAQDEPTVSPEVRKIVANALPAIRSGGADWIAGKDCLSCHRVSFQVWSLNRAAESGFATDAKQLNDWNSWATDWTNMVKPERRPDAKKDDVLKKESDTVAQLLLGRSKTHAEETDWVTTYRQQLLDGQKANGPWNSAGQLPVQKRPKRETQEVTTMWTLLGLQASGMDSRKFAPAMKKARGWLGDKTKGQSTEWWATRLLIERLSGNADRANNLRSTLLQQQNEDGGWGWLTEDNSDALGTGIALFALARDGVQYKDVAIQEAVAFLGASQQKDGSWKVNGTKKAYRDDVTETASYWGTCWVVIGLLEFDRKSQPSEE